MTVVDGAPARPATCPGWCSLPHGVHGGEDDQLHVSDAVLVRGAAVRLCVTVDATTGDRDGPYLLLGSEEFTLAEADQLVEAITRLLTDGR